MTLKEKFLPKMYCFMGSGMLSNSYDENVAQGNAKECEKIADEFAIGFADWIRVCKLKGRPYDFDNIKELLEIYKDEKEL